MEPRLKSNGHGYYALSYWSYKDQEWKSAKGSKDLSVCITDQMRYYARFIEYLTGILNRIPGLYILDSYESETKLIIIGTYKTAHMKINILKNDFLKVSVTGSKSVDRQVIVETILHAVLDDDFMLRLGN